MSPWRPLGWLWALPNTALGLTLGLAGCLLGGRVTVADGVIEIHGRLLRMVLRRGTLLRGGVSAITFGHVVLGQDASTLRRCRAHEHVHVRQYERWGPFFLPAYVASSAWALLRGRHPYRDNRFEQQAYRITDPPEALAPRIPTR